MKNKKLFIIIICIIVLISVCVLLRRANLNNIQMNDEKENEKTYEKEYEEMKDNSTMYDQNSTLDQLKEEYNVTGENDIYQVETEKDGRKVITVNPSVDFKVAFSGMIKRLKPDFSEIDSIYEKNAPKYNGIWIYSNDREKILEYLNNNELLKAKYRVNEEGYLEIDLTNDSTEIDKKIQYIINSNKQYILCISSICYMIDTVTGNIVDNPYNELEEYQTYEYFNDENKIIIFITENKENVMNNNEIFNSIIDLMNLQV